MRFIFSEIKFDRFEHKPITYYLDEGGNDHNDGLTWKTRKRTIKHLDGVLIEGDTIYFGGVIRGPVAMGIVEGKRPFRDRRKDEESVVEEIVVKDCYFIESTEGVGVYIH